MKTIRNILKNTTVLLISLSVCFVALEIFLRAYNPFLIRVRINKIVLPTNRKMIIENNKIKKLDKVIIHTKNSLGFRGEEPPFNFRDYLSIIAVGGSTTECLYLSDNKAWPYLVGENLKRSFDYVWLNNAGLDGHSTYGHKILLEDYLIKLRPKIVLFLVGCNEIERDDLNKYDKSIFPNVYKKEKKAFWNNSAVISLALNINRGIEAQKRQVWHGKRVKFFKKDVKKMSDKEVEQELERHRLTYIESYKKRLSQLIYMSKSSGIDPVLITQPAVFGKAADDFKIYRFRDSGIYEYDGPMFWKILELYNDATKEVAEENDVLVIDLADQLPKNTLYFYDDFHYTNQGAEEVAQIISEELQKYLDKKYSKFKTRNNIVKAAQP